MKESCSYHNRRNGGFPLTDARGIFCCYVCDDCYEEKKKRYRPEIFEDSQYDAWDEQVEADY